MGALSIFLDLNDKDFFIGAVKGRFNAAAENLMPLVEVAHEIDDARVEFAYGEYRQNIEQFSVLLQSEDPDHYKRAGALMHALSRSGVVTDICYDPDKDEIEGGLTRLQYHDGQYTITMMEFYNEYHNEMVAFDFAYDCCASYEEVPTGYNFEYLRNVCRYLSDSGSVSLDSCFMLFRSLMQR